MMMFNQEVENDQAIKTRPLNKYNLIITVYTQSLGGMTFFTYIH